MPSKLSTSRVDRVAVRIHVMHIVDRGRHREGQAIDVAERAGIGQRPIWLSRETHLFAPVDAAQIHEVGVEAPIAAGDARLADKAIIQHRRDDRQLVGLNGSSSCSGRHSLRFGIGPAEEAFDIGGVGQDVARAEMPALEVLLVGGRLEIEAGAPISLMSNRPSPSIWPRNSSCQFVRSLAVRLVPTRDPRPCRSLRCGTAR